MLATMRDHVAILDALSSKTPATAELPSAVDVYTLTMEITFDEAKRVRTLRERGLDFEDAREVFEGPRIEGPDLRRDYGEHRVICYGWLADRLIVVVYTLRDDARRIISMRKANDREKARIATRHRF